MSTLLSRFLNYIYKGEVERPARLIESFEIEVDRKVGADENFVRETSDTNQQPVSTHSKEIVVSKVILNINRVLTFICLSSFLTMAVFSIKYPTQPIPDILQNSFFVTLGWFGSAFTNFFQVDRNGAVG